MTESLSVCPECDTTHIRKRTGDDVHATRRVGDPDAEYICRECGHCFDAPATREVANPHWPRQAILERNGIDVE